MLMLIPDNTTLRSFIPNTFGSAMGDPTLFDKMQPFLVSAETWLISNFIPSDILSGLIEQAAAQDDPLYFLPRRIVALKAWERAVPSLDVVVSNNGIQVVETGNTKPASAAKVERLVNSVRAELDTVLSAFVDLLPAVPGWISSKQAETFGSTLHPNFGVLLSLGINGDFWTQYLMVTPELEAIEDRIAEQWISLPVMRRLRRKSLAGNPSHEEEYVIRKVRAATREIYVKSNRGLDPQSGLYTSHPLELASEFVRTRPDVFPEWRDSATARRFAAPVFRNRPDDTAYFF